MVNKNKIILNSTHQNSNLNDRRINELVIKMDINNACLKLIFKLVIYKFGINLFLIYKPVSVIMPSKNKNRLKYKEIKILKELEFGSEKFKIETRENKASRQLINIKKTCLFGFKFIFIITHLIIYRNLL